MFHRWSKDAAKNLVGGRNNREEMRKEENLQLLLVVFKSPDFNQWEGINVG